MVITMPSYDINIVMVCKLFHNRFVSYTVINNPYMSVFVKFRI